MVTVGSLDPYWKHKQLQNFGNAIANAVEYANQAKEKKRAKVRAEFEGALELGQADPQAGLIAISELEDRYKEKLLDKSVPERNAYRSLMAKKAEEGEPMENAWSKFSKSLVTREDEIAELQREIQAIPQVIGLDPNTTNPQQYMDAMMRFAQGDAMAMQQPNPAFAEKAQLLEQMTNPDLLAQAAYGDLSAAERIHMQRWINQEELDLGQLFGMVDRSKLSTKVKNVEAGAQGLLSPEGEQAGRVEAKLEMSPADKDKARWNAMRDELRSSLRMDEEELRQTGRTELEELRQSGTRERLNLQSDLGIGTGGKGKTGGAGAAADGGPSFQEVLRKNKKLSAGKYAVSTDVAAQLEARAAEFVAASGGRVTEEDAANVILDMYTESFDTTSDLEDDLRPGAALERVLNWGQEKKEEEPLPPGASVGAPTIRPPQGSGGR